MDSNTENFIQPKNAEECSQLLDARLKEFYDNKDSEAKQVLENIHQENLQPEIDLDDEFTQEIANKLADDVLFCADEVGKKAFCELFRKLSLSGIHAAHISRFVCRHAFINYTTEIDNAFESYLKGGQQ